MQKEGIFLSQKENWTWIIFVTLEIDFEILVQEKQMEDEILS